MAPADIKYYSMTVMGPGREGTLQNQMKIISIKKITS